MDQVIYRCGDCQFDTANRRFTRGGQELLLEPTVYAVLAQLLMRPGQLLTREALLDSVWGHRFVVRHDNAIRAGESLRQEDVINEAAAMLQEFAGGAAPPPRME